MVTLKIFFAAKTRKRHYRNHTSINPPRPLKVWLRRYWVAHFQPPNPRTPQSPPPQRPLANSPPPPEFREIAGGWFAAGVGLTAPPGWQYLVPLLVSGDSQRRHTRVCTMCVCVCPLGLVCIVCCTRVDAVGVQHPASGTRKKRRCPWFSDAPPNLSNNDHLLTSKHG